MKSQPASGRLVIHISADINSWANTPADIEMHTGDVLTVPKRPGFVLVSGQVYNASAITFVPGKEASWYLRRAGGTNDVANRKEIFVIRANGSVIGRRSGEWYGSNVLSTRLDPGDVIVVPQKIIGGSLFWKNLLTVAQISSSIAFTAAVAGAYRFTMRRSAMLLLVALMCTHSYAQAHPGPPGMDTESASPPIWRRRIFRSKAGSIPRLRGWHWPAMFRPRSPGCVRGRGWKVRGWSPRPRSNNDHENDLDSGEGVDEQMNNLIRELANEFAVELRQRDGQCNRQAAIDSIDWRSTAIAGTPITDGYHCAQTLTNDYGRPYGQGSNLYTGIAARAASGPFASYLRAELQRTAPGPMTPFSADAAIAAADFTPLAAAGPASGFTRGRVLEGYVSYTFHNNQFSFGKQALWWGPSKGGPLLFSNNAEPITMLRYDRVSPFELPGFGRWLGPIRVQLFLGRLSGQQFVHVGSQTLGQPGVALNDQPFINGQKFSLKPTPNLEFSVSRTVIFAGAGAPFTTKSFLRSLFSTSNSAPGPTIRAIAGLMWTSNTQFQSSTIC